ncbi:class A beta-lactamase, subclass A2 [Agaribacter flavus]|uniref:Beta-lactamase n=1 Tax=Agaribacter flavus TaxID=1902781 RepID=A0ABV7FL63_9ALTE
MIKKTALSVVMLLSISLQAVAKDVTNLKQNIEDLLATKNATVGVEIVGPHRKDVVSINSHARFPMQSVFKFHIALVVLSEVDKGKLSLEQNITLDKSQLLPGLWSPIREKYPEGVTLPLAEIVEYTVALSDNAGCDALLRLLGGPLVVENYFAGLGFKDFEVKINEETMQSDWDSQFLNWTSPAESNRILIRFFENKNNELSPQSHNFIWGVMKGTKTGKNRLRGYLPEKTVVAHKTGWSGRNKKTGVTAAVNNVGIVFLPNGEHFFISVFVTDSREDFNTNERIIADIARAAWDYFTAD